MGQKQINTYIYKRLGNNPWLILRSGSKLLTKNVRIILCIYEVWTKYVTG